MKTVAQLCSARKMCSRLGSIFMLAVRKPTLSGGHCEGARDMVGSKLCEGWGYTYARLVW